MRQGQGIVPTDFAPRLELPLRALLDELEALLSGPERFDPSRAERGFKISGSDFHAEMLMPALARQLAAEVPLMRVQLVDLIRDNHPKTLRDDTIDLALIPEVVFPDWIDHAAAYRSGFVMIARNGHGRLDRASIAPGDVVPIDLFCDLGHVAFSPEGKDRMLGDKALARVGRHAGSS